MQEVPHVKEQNLHIGVSEKGTGISMSTLTAQESPATKGCITTASLWLWNYKVANKSGPIQCLLVFWHLRGCFTHYMRHNLSCKCTTFLTVAGSGLETLTTEDCLRLQKAKTVPHTSCNSPEAQRPPLSLYRNISMKRGMEIRMACEVHWFLQGSHCSYIFESYATLVTFG